MENENLTPSPEQPRYTPPASPFHIPAPFVEEPPLPPQEAAQPEYQEPAEPQNAPPAEPQNAPPAEPQYAPPAEPPYQPPSPQYQPYQQPAQTQYEQYRQPVAQPPEQEPPKKKSKRWKIVLPVVAIVLALAVAAGVYFLFLRRPAEEATNFVGKWQFDGAFIDDTYYATGDCRLTVYEDGRAALVIDGRNTGLTWRSDYSEAGVEYYDVTADDGTVCEFWYYAESGGDFAGKLVLYGNDENMFIFKK